MEKNTLQEMYVDELKDLYSAETQISKALPKLAAAATNPELKAGFQSHLKQTQGHLARLDQIFDGLGRAASGKHCKAMAGLISEGEELIKDRSAGETIDAGLICAAQKVEHYEIAGYGTVRTWADLLGEIAAVKLLQEILNEERQTDEKLTGLAEGHINIQAMNEHASARSSAQAAR